ncbi:MAG TPA: hypothetical protein VGN73_06310 [Gemmatimonadaceae bacterium]|nr:hypothetical protein [Gemmatimonadaceae bacterium]
MIVPAAITRGTARLPGLLITAWDSVSNQRWGQMERYSVGREPGLVTYTFGRPGDSSQTGGFAALTVSKERPRR